MIFISRLSESSRVMIRSIQRAGITMYLLTEWEGRTGNIWPEVMAYGPCAARSVRHDRGPNILLSGPT